MIKINQEIVIQNWRGNHNEPLLSILCDTFNHEDFIEEALLGFLNQKSNFPFEIIVHDDASTDRTTEIVADYAKRFPLIVKPIFQKHNQYSQKLNFWANYTFPKAKGKYIALCEGDDYWIDTLKIQKQVDFLESNTDVAITWTNFVKKWDNKIEMTNFSEVLPLVFYIDFNNLFDPYCTYTLTSLFRKTSFNIDRYASMQYAKDNTLYSLVLCNGKGVFLNFESAVYRQHKGGVYSLQLPFFQKYSSYLNVNEIYESIPESNTKNVKYILDCLLRDSAIEANLLKAKGNKLEKYQINLIETYTKTLNIKHKVKFYFSYLRNKFNFYKGIQIFIFYIF